MTLNLKKVQTIDFDDETITVQPKGFYSTDRALWGPNSWWRNPLTSNRQSRRRGDCSGGLSQIPTKENDSNHHERKQSKIKKKKKKETESELEKLQTVDFDIAPLMLIPNENDTSHQKRKRSKNKIKQMKKIDDQPWKRKKKKSVDKIKMKKELELKMEKYARQGRSWKRSENKITKSKEYKIIEALESAARTEILLPSEQGYLEAEGMERTWEFSQEKLRKHLDIRTQDKMFNLKLDNFGPYTMDYTRNGRYLLLAGEKGHIALINWQTKELAMEIHVREAIRDVKFLHDETMFAVAQKNYLYIYDNSGIELHELRKYNNKNVLEFLPYHFLLASVDRYFLQWIDTSTGEMAAKHRTRLGDCHVMRANSHNAVLCLGHNNGCVTMWSPNVNQPLIKMLCHKASVTALSVDVNGKYLVTAGLDNVVKVWDVRTYKPLHSIVSWQPAKTIDISHTGLLGVGYGPMVEIWKDALLRKPKKPYMVEKLSGCIIKRIRFCPYEDVIGVSHNRGFSNLIIPGSGEPNFDTFEANPYRTKKQRREQTVHRLLDKLQPDMITLEPLFIGMDSRSREYVQKQHLSQKKISAKEAIERGSSKYRTRGITQKWKRKKMMEDAYRTRQRKIENMEKTVKEKKDMDQQDPKQYNTLDRFRP